MFSQLPSTYSQEAVDFKLDSKFLDELAEQIEKIRQGMSVHSGKTKQTANRVINESDLLKVIKKYTNLTVDIQAMTPEEFGKYNAAVISAIFDKNHPLLDEMRSEFYTGDDLNRILRKNNNTFKAAIDLSKGRVSGAFAETEVPMFVTIPMLSDGKFSIREVAAILLHEVGHILTFMEYLGRSYLTVHTLEFVSRNYNATKSDVQRTEIIKVVADEYDLNISDVEKTGREVKSGEVINTMIVKSTREQNHHITNTPMYEARTSEAIADQYVARIGGARELATAVDKLNREFGGNPYTSVLGLALMTILTTSFSGAAGGLAGMIIGFGIGVVLVISMFVMYLATDQRHEYDPPHLRLARLRKELVEAMKLPSLDRQTRRKLQDDVKLIEKLESETSKHEPLGRVIWNNITSTRRAEKQRMEELQKLEQLLVNPLYIKHNELAAR